MLTAGDTPTIRFAINRRLDLESGVSVLEILTQPYAAGDWYPNTDAGLERRAGEPFIRVGVLIMLGHLITLRSKFDLPDPFEHGHLLNQIDEIAEQCKRARKGFFTSSAGARERKLSGTGMREHWSRYGTLMGRNG